MTTPILPKLLEAYTEEHTTPEHPVLAALNRETNLKRGDAVMLSGHIQGALLQMLSHMIQPRYVLEIGTYTGYSAICLAQGLQTDGMLHTIELDEELEDIASKYIITSGLRDKITQHIGAASDIIPALENSFDLAFIDADKVNYSHYYDLIFDKVAIGGYIIADNVLYDGEVVLPESERSKNANAIHAFNEKVKADKRIQHLLLPVRDGLMILRKLTN